MRISIKHLVIVAVAVVAAGSLTPAADAASINRRQATQQRRIAQGIASGSLTPREAIRLERLEARLARQEAAMRRSGGHLTPRERAVLDRNLDHLSAAISREKHDPQRRR